MKTFKQFTLDELNQKTLKKYVAKSVSNNFGKSGDNVKRVSGIQRAMDKIKKRSSVNVYATEDAAANSVAAGGVDMNPNGVDTQIGFVRRDKRKKFDVEQMFKRANGKYKK